ncbi:hypothetical protein [Flammeovirga sp. SJP92]|uniref:hypothetical protein n=1 Tax=Flammeovirga sp. SJP92 TaxID=1775430 RepID=UPI0007891FF5|nr:hypothetical protein [Flammeovirga sp. SJP92]KXX66870.1 hypothetical protein AVL50_30530 [Flammeovirga sp. SJP92]
MKYAEFKIENNKIEFFNSVFGVESVLLNGKPSSKKFSFSGFNHQLSLNSKNLTLKSNYKQFGKRQIELELIQNGEIIEQQVVKTNVFQRFSWVFLVTFLGIGTYKILNFLIDSLTS